MSRFVKNVREIAYSIYTFTLFFLGLPVMAVFYLLILPFPTTKRLRLTFAINRVWVKIWAKLSGITIEVANAEKINKDQTYIFLSNHCNLFDIVMCGSSIQHPFKPLIKRELLYVPILGQLFLTATIPVDRSSKESRQKSMDRMLNNLKRNVSILIFPEGTRNRSKNPLKAFYDGGFRLAIAGQTPIMPVILLNNRSLQPVGTFRIYPGKVSVHFLDPIETKGMTNADLESLKKKVHSLMGSFILKNDDYFQANLPSSP